MKVTVVASGSNGNCCMVENNGTSLLIDAGKSCSEIEKRLERQGKNLDNLKAIVLTHAHTDHTSGAGPISRKYNVPVFLKKTMYEKARKKIGKTQYKFFSGKFRINGTEITPVKTSHSIASYGYVIGKFGLFTDTGIPTSDMEKIMPKLEGVLLESNHDVDMLINGPYPYYLKQLILSNEGHLNNIDACNFVENFGENISYVLLGHLSGTNNTPKAAKQTFESLVKRKVDFHVCSREKLSGTWKI